ncbi:helix-turn-helix domain-containing protein [Bradyrhizobium sediminis]|uniref:Helix-turn-helix domain-containing protein n=1 Tax=Bradyrhizobium sediminis TaxID=2840469 RepID=A0A975RVZ0_9BRAD|nr:helix-turn-helix transcriptional regulator [Bradyrhizobium sediminis]QWG22200.1 helix-turn-helix domain-containing protein [Bradyrhizobium sediminis]
MTPSARGIGKTVHSSDQAAFCAMMVAARKDAGLTQQALARRLKRPQSFVAKYEGGERRLDVVEFVAIVRAIGADPVKLLRDFVSGKSPPKARTSPAK